MITASYVVESAPFKSVTCLIEIAMDGTTHYFYTPYEEVAKVIVESVNESQNTTKVSSALVLDLAGSEEFNPDWVSCPGDTIRDCILELDLFMSEFAADMALSSKEVGRLIEGDLPIDEYIARDLERVLGPSKQFWLNREKNYRDGLEKGRRRIYT